MSNRRYAIGGDGRRSSGRSLQLIRSRRSGRRDPQVACQFRATTHSNQSVGIMSITAGIVRTSPEQLVPQQNPDLLGGLRHRHRRECPRRTRADAWNAWITAPAQHPTDPPAAGAPPVVRPRACGAALLCWIDTHRTGEPLVRGLDASYRRDDIVLLCVRRESTVAPTGQARQPVRRLALGPWRGWVEVPVSCASTTRSGWRVR